MAYSFFWQEFPSQLSDVKDALPLILDVYRGKDVAEEDAALAIFNGAGFIYKLTRGRTDPPVFAAVKSPPEDVEEAFAQAIAESKEPATMQAGEPVGSAWLAILAPIILDLARKWLLR